MQRRYLRTGASIPPEAMMRSFLLQIPPLFPKKFSDSVENFHKLTFSQQKIVDFHLPKFLMTVFGHSLEIFNFPLFSLFQYISPFFRKIIISPLLLQISPLIS